MKAILILLADLALIGGVNYPCDRTCWAAYVLWALLATLVPLVHILGCFRSHYLREEYWANRTFFTEKIRYRICASVFTWLCWVLWASPPATWWVIGADLLLRSNSLLRLACKHEWCSKKTSYDLHQPEIERRLLVSSPTLHGWCSSVLPFNKPAQNCQPL